LAGPVHCDAALSMSSQAFDPNTVPTLEEVMDSDTSAWVASSKLQRTRIGKSGISPSYRPWTNNPGEPKKLWEVPRSSRHMDLVDVAWASRDVTARDMPFFTDISQDVAWRPWGPRPPCLTTSSIVFDFQADQIWSPCAKLAAHGWPVADVLIPSSFQGRDLDDLVGESMYLPNVAAVLLAIYLNPLSPWWGFSSDDGIPSESHAPPPS
jgi:hypothetical protein